MVRFRLRNDLQSIQQRLRLLRFQPEHFVFTRELCGDTPRIEDRLDEVHFAIEAVANELERLDLRGKGTLLLFELIPSARRLRIRVIAHHFDKIGMELAPEVQSRRGMLERRLPLESEVIPERKR